MGRLDEVALKTGFDQRTNVMENEEGTYCTQRDRNKLKEGVIIVLDMFVNEVTA